MSAHRRDLSGSWRRSVESDQSSSGQNIRFTNCRLLRGGTLVWRDLWINTASGRIVDYAGRIADAIHDLRGCIIAPGFIDCQLNGAFGFNFSTIYDDMSQYATELAEVNKKLVETGVTSYLPTITSQQDEVYHKVIPLLVPTPQPTPFPPLNHKPGSSVLGAHLEGPFLNPDKCGVHDPSVLKSADSFEDVEKVYNFSNQPPGAIKMITLAPEKVYRDDRIINKLKEAGIVVSVGHTTASFDVAFGAFEDGATMLTHYFNAMPPIGHRKANVSNLIIPTPEMWFPPPYFGIIADGIHTNGSAIMLAHLVNPDKLILVTDGMHVLGLEDGTCSWRNGSREWSITKSRGKVTAPSMAENGESEPVLAGSAVTLLECVNHFLRSINLGTGTVGLSVQECRLRDIVSALQAVTERPAKMLGLEATIGTLEIMRHADLVVLDDATVNGQPELRLKEVWKHGAMVMQATSPSDRPWRGDNS
ncbi:hypothetical protein QBC36DRAFT_333343 [Triangularia setosa]|uniref:Amidohydrolase-related domain-containing protein n=1 Tax=Triangularia setosa TaxID=2587417 RepID=A0AAN6W3R3_9PEZI|nr:hypothetical protein QBC36DRAFT_333343 [Podospora setosa]